jgi:hypothetical protein
MYICRLKQWRNIMQTEWKVLDENDFSIIEGFIDTFETEDHKRIANTQFDYAKSINWAWFRFVEPSIATTGLHNTWPPIQWEFAGCPNRHWHHVGSTCKLCGLKD